MTWTSWPRPRRASTSGPASGPRPRARRDGLPRVERGGTWSVWNIGASIAACSAWSTPRRPCTARSRNVSCHWSCWSPPGVPKASHGSAVAQRQRGRQRGARARAGAQRGRQARLEPEHLAAGAEREPEPGDRPASTAASRRTAWPTPGCPSGRRRRGGRCRRGRRRRPRPATVGSPTPGLGVARRRPRPCAATAPAREPGARPPGLSRAQLEDAAARRPAPARSAAYSRASSSRRQRDVARPGRRTRPRGRRTRASAHSTTGAPSDGSASARSSGRPSAVEQAQCCSSTGPWPHGPVLATSTPR